MKYRNRRNHSQGVPMRASALLLAGALTSLSCGDVVDPGADPVRKTESAALVSGPVYDKWISTGGARGPLGSPSTDELVTPDGRGRFAHFPGLQGTRTAFPPGSIYWTPTTGAWVITGQTRDRWSELGWERGALGYPMSDELPWGAGTAQAFEGGSIIRDQPFIEHFRFFAQNMALLVTPAPYKGTDREAAKQGLINFLRAEKPQVVGLSEVFMDSERAEIRSQLADLYPFWLEGPDENDAESDGGLLLLSKYALSATNQAIYRSCIGEDCLTNKGVLKARVDLPGDRDIDVYLTHLQSPNPAVGSPNVGAGSSGPGKVKVQLNVLGDFIAATRDRTIPALLMGDLNVNGRDAALYNDMMARLRFPMDVAVALGQLTPQGLGTTNGDPLSSFPPNSALRDPWDLARFQSGSRLDYMLNYHGTAFRANFRYMNVYAVPDTNGRDISDHYGVMATILDMQRVETRYSRTLTSVTARVTHLHSLKETDGPFGSTSEALGSDEVEFQLRVTPSVGSAITSRVSGRRGDVDRGEIHTVAAPPSVTVNNPGDVITVRVQGWEVDTVAGFTSRESLGTATMSLHKNELFDSFLAPIERKFLLRSTAGGEYVMTVTLSAR